MVGSNVEYLLEYRWLPVLFGAKLVQDRDRMFALKLLDKFDGRRGSNGSHHFLFGQETLLVHFDVERQRFQGAFAMATEPFSRLPTHFLQQFHAHSTGHRRSTGEQVFLHPSLMILTIDITLNERGKKKQVCIS